MNTENQLIEFIADSLATADSGFIEDFTKNGPIPGGPDDAFRYLLAIALRNKTASDFAALTGVSEAVASELLNWLAAGTSA